MWFKKEKQRKRMREKREIERKIKKKEKGEIDKNERICELSLLENYKYEKYVNIYLRYCYLSEITITMR